MLNMVIIGIKQNRRDFMNKELFVNTINEMEKLYKEVGEENIDKNNNAEEIKQVEQIHEHPEEDNKPIEDKNDNQQIEDNKPEEKKEEEKVPEEKKEEPTLESLKEMIKEKDLLITQLQSEKESLLVELSNEKVSHENEVSDLLGKLEVERVFHDVQRKTESQLNDKIISMKSMITELHNQFQKELEQKDKLKKLT